MPNLLQFSATPSGKSIAIKASYDDNTTISFSTDEQSASFMTSIVQALAAANKKVSAAENRAAAAARTTDRKYKRTGDNFENGAVPTTCDAEFMRLVRAVCPKYNENTKDDDPRLVALDVLRYAPAEAFSAAYSRPMSEIQLNESIEVLTQVGDYMKANNINPKPYTVLDTLNLMGDAAKKMWGK